ncbi:hypothetical protein OUZ56_002949 [Daphnia magna]|uniref:Uncharacterized protein n=1 Tax=Daphnia magna TaxID=35525 RepID=A0ABR0A7B1_9CRUS|nr:hypothetical protein OUZ56_002949 [Daphnia magna]
MSGRDPAKKQNISPRHNFGSCWTNLSVELLQRGSIAAPAEFPLAPYIGGALELLLTENVF